MSVDQMPIQPAQAPERIDAVAEASGKFLNRQSAIHNPQSFWLARAVVALAALITALLHLPLQVFPIGRDQGAWLTGAMALAHGKVFYRDYLHFNMPGLAFAYRLAWAFVSDPHYVAPLLAAVAAVLIVLALYLLLSETISPAAGAWAALVFGVLWPVKIGWWSVGQKDILATPWLLLATWCVARALPGRRLPRLSLFAGGGCIALAAQCKPTYIVIGVLLAAGLALRHGRTFRATWKSLLREIGLFAAGGVLGLAPLLIYLALHHAFADAWFCLTVLGGDYVTAHNLSWRMLARVWRIAQRGNFWSGFNFTPLWLATCYAGIPLWLTSREQPRRWWLFPPAFTAATAFFLQRKGMTYHLDPWYAGLCLFGGVALAWAWRRRNFFPWRKTSAIYLAAGLLFTFAFAKTMHHSFTDSRYMKLEWRAWRGELTRGAYLNKLDNGKGDHPGPTVSESLAAWLRERTTPRETILVWGHECQIYALADRLFATQAPFKQMLTGIDPTREPPGLTAQKQRFLRLLDVDAPKFFLVTTHDANPVERITSDRALSRVAGLPEYLAAHYTFLQWYDRFQVYQRNP